MLNGAGILNIDVPKDVELEKTKFSKEEPVNALNPFNAVPAGKFGSKEGATEIEFKRLV
jgi:hypothetical protein